MKSLKTVQNTVLVKENVIQQRQLHSCRYSLQKKIILLLEKHGILRMQNSGMWKGPMFSVPGFLPRVAPPQAGSGNGQFGLSTSVALDEKRYHVHCVWQGRQY